MRNRPPLRGCGGRCGGEEQAAGPMWPMWTRGPGDQMWGAMRAWGRGHVLGREPGGLGSCGYLDLPVTSYSGGWKMKMQLCAAKLMHCDVLTLDEPTGNLYRSEQHAGLINY